MPKVDWIMCLVLFVDLINTMGRAITRIVPGSNRHAKPKISLAILVLLLLIMIILIVVYYVNNVIRLCKNRLQM
jgi:hypothetical protein